MSNKSVIALLVAGSLFAASSAFADHNSVWGAGSANMPNDIHNSAIEDDQDVFLDLVQYGDGADSVNRYDDTSEDSTDTDMGGSAASVDTDTTLMSSSSRMSGSGGSLVSRAATVSRGGSRR